jgi:flagellar basal body-associated protein FliL
MENISDKTLGKLVSLAILAVGLAVGFAGGVMYRPQQAVQAQVANPPQPNIQEVSPGVTTGTFGANLILAHEVATDRLIINGFDLMLMNQNILNYLGSRPYNERADIQNIINNSRAATIYRLKQTVPAPSTPPAEKKP